MLVVLGIVYVVLRARAVLVVHEVWGDMPDSAGYRPVGGGASVDLVDPTGGAIRPWTVPTLYAALGTDGARAAAQVVVSIAAWLGLALVVARTIVRPVVALLGAVALLTVSCTWGVVVWDLAILAESFALSFAVALVAAWIAHLARPSWLTAAAVVGFSTLWLFTRLQHLPIVALTASAALVLVAGRPVRRSVAALTAIGLVLVTAWGVAILGPQDRGYEARDGHGVSLFGETFALNLRFVILPDPEATQWFRDRGMPEPDELVARPRVATIHDDAWETWPDFFARYRADAELRAWVETEGRRAFTEWTVANAGSLAVRFGSEVDEVLVPPASTLGYAFPEPILPPPIAAWVAPQAGEGRPPFVVLVALAAGVSVVVRRRLPANRPVLVVGAAVVTASVAGLFLAWLGSPVEYTRHAVPFGPVLGVGALLVLLAVWDDPPGRQDRSRGPARTEDPPGGPAEGGAGWA